MTDKFDKEQAAALLREYMIVFGVGAIGYSSIEILWRGRTHWTMALTGGACLDGLYAMAKREKGPLWKYCLRGSGLITAAELIVGLIVNRRLKWNVWDYSRIPLNVMGQICPVYSFLWFLLCRPGNAVCRRLDQLIHRA